MSKCTLYRHFDAQGNLLYVGITNYEPKRRNEHKLEAKWFKEIARVETAEFDTRAEAAVAEITAIFTEKPLHNIESRRVISQKAEAQRKRLERERKRTSGNEKLEVWAPKRLHEKVKKYVARLLKR